MNLFPAGLGLFALGLLLYWLTAGVLATIGLVAAVIGAVLLIFALVEAVGHR